MINYQFKKGVRVVKKKKSKTVWSTIDIVCIPVIVIHKLS